MNRVRPTIRCLRDDLHLPLPPQTVPLDEVNHPLLRKANEQFADERTSHERIVEIDDQVLLKVKVQRWRGAVWTEPVRVTGSVPLNLVGAILDLIPGCDPDGWFPEFAGLPHRRLLSGEVAWSNIMDPSAAAKLLEADRP